MITYFTDGSCSPNPGPGGFAVIKDDRPEIVGYELDSTNIRMEGKALIAALADANGEPCKVLTDSEFWVNVLTKWASGWKSSGWRKRNGEIKNLDIVKELFDLYENSNAELVWVRGHNGNCNNELADDWANRARVQRLSGYIQEGWI